MKTRLLVAVIACCFIFSSCCTALNYLLTAQNKTKNTPENHAVVSPEASESSTK